MDSTLSVKGAPADSKAVGDAITLKADKVSPHLFTIPITGWQTDDTVPGFTNYIDIAIDGMTDVDIVNVNVAPVSTTVAAKAQVLKANPALPLQKSLFEFPLRPKDFLNLFP